MSSSDASIRENTELISIYSFAHELNTAAEKSTPLTSVLQFGRFATHIDAAGRLFPGVLLSESIDAEQLRLGPSATCRQFQEVVRIQSAQAIVTTTPRGDGLLILKLELAGDPNCKDVAELTYSTWRCRTEMQIGDQMLVEWLNQRLLLQGYVEDISFGRNVHQIVLAGGSLAADLLRENADPETISPGLIDLAMRRTVPSTGSGSFGIRRPLTLNSGTTQLVAHGRGVSIIAGWSRSVENAFLLTACCLTNAASVAHRIRRQALMALEMSEATDSATIDESRSLIRNLSIHLNHLQLDLSFGIEIYTDSILMPEMVVEAYQTSLRQAAGLAQSVANTSMIIERLGMVLTLRRSELQAAGREYDEARDRIFSVSVALGTLLTIPPALLLAYFGVNSSDIDTTASIFSIEKYGLVYLMVWVPFVAITVVSAVLRRRVRMQKPLWRRSVETR